MSLDFWVMSDFKKTAVGKTAETDRASMSILLMIQAASILSLATVFWYIDTEVGAMCRNIKPLFNFDPPGDA